MTASKSSIWFTDHLSPFEGHLYGVRNILFSTQTKYQKIDILQTDGYGRCLVLDGKMQSSEADEFIYHEALVHPAMLTHPNPKRVFIVGGGEGATIREIVRYPSVEKVVMIDIDQEVVEASRRYLPEWSQGAFDDSRVTVAYFDARRYLEENADVYDVIIIDISEPVDDGPAYLLYTKEFYEVVTKRLGPEGVITLQAGTTAGSLPCLAAVYNTLKTVFPVVAPYLASIPSFGLPWGFILASKGPDPGSLTKEEVDRRITCLPSASTENGVLRYYHGGLHHAQFVLPKHIREAMGTQVRIIEDNYPISVYN